MCALILGVANLVIFFLMKVSQPSKPGAPWSASLFSTKLRLIPVRGLTVTPTGLPIHTHTYSKTHTHTHTRYQRIHNQTIRAMAPTVITMVTSEAILEYLANLSALSASESSVVADMAITEREIKTSMTMISHGNLSLITCPLRSPVAEGTEICFITHTTILRSCIFVDETEPSPHTAVASLLTTQPWPIHQIRIGTSWAVSNTDHNRR